MLISHIGRRIILPSIIRSTETRHHPGFCVLKKRKTISQLVALAVFVKGEDDEKKISVTLTGAIICVMGMLLFAGCGSMTGQNLEDYMKGQPSLRQSVDAQLSILTPDAKASVQYTEDNKAEVTVQYYAMTDEEIAAIEPEKAEIRCKSILKPVMEQFAEDTGGTAEVVVTVEGHITE